MTQKCWIVHGGFGYNSDLLGIYTEERGAIARRQQVLDEYVRENNRKLSSSLTIEEVEMDAPISVPMYGE